MTTSADAAPVRPATPIAAIRSPSTSIDSTSARGVDSTPVASAPMLTIPSVVMPSGRSSVLAQASIHDRAGARPVVGAEHPRVHHGLGGGIEHLVLELASPELAADEVPDQLEQLHTVAGIHTRPPEEPLE